MVLALIAPADAEVGPALWLALVLGIDVAHVWATLFRTWLDAEERRRHPVRYVALPIAVFAAGTAIYAASPPAFWSAMAYLAVYHFARQQAGVLALYRAREGLPRLGLEARVERALLYASMAWPILWWHVHLPRPFDWFLPGDFLAGLPEAALAPAGWLTAALLVAHVASRVASRRWSPGRDLWLACTALTWNAGIVWTDNDLAFTATNVVIHGLTYHVLVAWTCRGQWAHEGRGPVEARWFQGWGLALYAAPLLALAFAEEAAWDLWIWHDQAWLFGTLDLPPAPVWLVPLLSVPQITHYLLDGLIWKLGPANPGLRQWLGLGGR